MKTKARLIACCIASSVFLGGSASASETFPDVVRQTWSVEDLVVSGKGCLLCHTSEQGSSSTVQRPFGLALLNDYDVRALNVASLRSALREMQPTSDVDEDGVTDYEELVVGTDLNVPDAPDPGTGAAGGAGGADAVDAAGRDGSGAMTGAPPKQFPILETGCTMRTNAVVSEWHLALLSSILLLRLRRRSRR